MNRNKLENLVTSGKCYGEKAKGTPRDKYVDTSAWRNRDRSTDYDPKLW